ncbi:MAG: HlyD family efflux transporter periplasmic adaptor subunit [Clostridia bacterium]|nr:HlyD family efflux transporter periplasmic adaptor subunit [Clostridia bacterium]
MENQTLEPVKEKNKKKKGKGKKTIIIIIAVLLIAALLIYFFLPKNQSNKVTGPTYVEGKAEKRTIQTTLSSSGTLQPADSYNVTASVTGDILECTFEEGDTVNEDDLLYVIDSSDMENTIDRAQISYDKTLRSYNKIVDSLEDLNVYSDYDGVVIDVYVEVGDEIQAGTKIAQLRDSDTMHLSIPFAAADANTLSVGQVGTAIIDGSFESRSATVTEIDSFESHLDGRAIKYVEVSVDNKSGGIFNVTQATVNFGDIACLASGTFEYNKEATISAKISGTVLSVISKGDRVKADSTLICALESETLQDNFKDAQASLDDAQLSFDNTKEKLDDYTIEAPITGTVIEKYSKVGDTLGSSSQGQSTLAIIYDLSYLKFDMALDELDISKVAVGQKVMISCDALEMNGIEGEITKVSVVGTTSYNSTSYPVTVKIYDPPQDLLAGMNVDAELILEEAVDVLTIPTAAVQRGNVVYVKDDGTKTPEDTAPEGYMSIKVETGLSNDNYIEIVSGDLEEGDTVYVPQAVHVTTNIFEQMASGQMPNGMQGGMGGNMGGNMGARPSGNMGGNMGGGMR